MFSREANSSLKLAHRVVRPYICSSKAVQILGFHYVLQEGASLDAQSSLRIDDVTQGMCRRAGDTLSNWLTRQSCSCISMYTVKGLTFMAATVFSMGTLGSTLCW